MLLIVIAFLCVAFFVQGRRAARRERELELQIESLAWEPFVSEATQKIDRSVPAPWKVQSERHQTANVSCQTWTSEAK
jgi:hypothetical protein